MKLILVYSPEAIRAITSRRVTSGSTTASRPRRPESIMTTKYCMAGSIYENRNKVKHSLPISGRDGGDRPSRRIAYRLSAGFGLAGAGRGLCPQPCNLPARQGDADFADPVEFHPIDRLGIETREIDEARALAALDRLQIALAGLELHRRLFPVEARERMGLGGIAPDHVAVLVFRQHRIARHLECNQFILDRKRQVDLAETFRRHLLLVRLDHRAGADPAHDRHRVETEIFHDQGDFRGLDQPY